MAHECQALAVRRPGQRVHRSLIDEHRLRFAIAARGHRQNCFLVDKQQSAAIGREARGVSLADLMRHATSRGNHPHFLGQWAFRRLNNVDRSVVPKILAPCKGDRLRIRRPGELSDIETVAVCVRCDLARFRAMGGVCNPDIAAALRVEYHATAEPVGAATMSYGYGACITSLSVKPADGVPQPAPVISRAAQAAAALQSRNFPKPKSIMCLLSRRFRISVDWKEFRHEQGQQSLR